VPAVIDESPAEGHHVGDDERVGEMAGARESMRKVSASSRIVMVVSD
jgi:hypothetical protein